VEGDHGDLRSERGARSRSRVSIERVDRRSNARARAGRGPALTVPLA
jgi:hypothetical protein